MKMQVEKRPRLAGHRLRRAASRKQTLSWTCRLGWVLAEEVRQGEGHSKAENKRRSTPRVVQLSQPSGAASQTAA